MSQKESECGKTEKPCEHYMAWNILNGYSYYRCMNCTFIDGEKTFSEAIATREKEIAEEVEKGIISRDGFCKKAHRDPCEGCAYNSGINDALNNVLSILKHQ